MVGRPVSNKINKEIEMTGKMKAISLTAVAALAAAGLVLAQHARAETAADPLGPGIGAAFGARHGAWSHHGERLKYVAQQLDLSDAQKEKIRSIIASHREEFRNAVRPLVLAHTEVIKQVLAEPVDQKALHAATEAVAQNTDAVALIAAKVIGEVRAELTPEQRAKLTDMKEKFLQRQSDRLDIERAVVDKLKE